MFALRTLCQNQKCLWRSWKPGIQTRFRSDEVNYDEDLFPNSENISLENESFAYLNEINLIGIVASNPTFKNASQKFAARVFFSLCTKHVHSSSKHFGKMYLFQTYHSIIVYQGKLQNYALENVKAGNRVFVNGEMRNKRFGMFVIPKKIILLEHLKN